ncbi:AraC family transcriptional regulator [Halomonas sp. BC04]|uniref:AraC family transcriptional regulator n=1 Tax=Halomonas sp. BC04 TaxID=1403540 RepID=UPI0003ED5D64|nr:AraC family transcriptional regulator [Halomonas sp. BC04]EWG97757.1 hypothetical protein Q427_34235 [Halomonas sp. BC04]
MKGGSDLINKKPDLEVIIPDPGHAFRWLQHDFPAPVSKWNYHPEYELHLITESEGQSFVGDHIGHFYPGDIFLIGPSLPHNWVSNLGSEHDLIEGRDVVVQFDHKILGQEAQALFPEISVAKKLLEDSKQGIRFTSGDLKKSRELIVSMKGRDGLEALAHFFNIISHLATRTQWETLSSPYFSPDLNPSTAKWMQIVTEYIMDNLGEEIRLSHVAAMVRMTDSTFSRFFRKNAGIGFSDYLTRLRIARACSLLRESEKKVVSVCTECGFNNISNFNRRFLKEKGMTPTEYRQSAWRQLFEQEN